MRHRPEQRAARLGIRGPVALAVVLLLSVCGGRPAPEQRDAGRLGTVRILRGARAPGALVFLFSDASGWSPALDRAALALADAGAVVVGVDLRRYLDGLGASDDGCHYVVAELEDLSKRLQRELRFEGYRSPILAGIGAGGTLAYAALGQSPAATVEGAASVDPAPALGTKVPLCEGAPASAAPGGGFAYGPKPDLPGWWRVDAVEGSAPEDRLVALLRPMLAPTAATTAAAALSRLPLIEIPADRPGPRMAVIYSGDGGWRDLDKEIGEVLARRGTPVVGVDSLRYFWRARTPDQVAADLSAILQHYRARWGTRQVVLVGYSFGACVLPFAVNRLPAADRGSVVQVSLLGLEPRASFEFHVTGWLGADPGGLAVLPEALRLDPARLQCFYGEEEAATLCRAPELAKAEIIRTAGGHHFDGDYPALAERILRGAERRAGASP